MTDELAATPWTPWSGHVQPVNSDAHLLVWLLQVPLDVPHPDLSGLVASDDLGLDRQYQT